VSSFVAIEWGTARLRARLISADGMILDEVNEEVQLSTLQRANIAERIAGLRARWPDAEAPFLLTGMIGSAQGWIEVPHIACPVGPEQIAANAVRSTIAGVDVTIGPGLRCISRFGDPDVLRGEEVAAIGLASDAALPDRALLVSVPGMHGKWIELASGRIIGFHTSITVEIYRALAAQSILAPLMAGTAKPGDAFRRGVERGGEGGGLGRLLFSARTGVSADTLSPEDATSYLWGILIGADIRENLGDDAGESRQCYVTGADDVAPLFVAALGHMGVAATLLDTDSVSARGFCRLRERAMT
jgi:2-dehydro-3-deoxygalactonokinase